jgi:predicted DNA-binding protein with PD1-like motif
MHDIEFKGGYQIRFVRGERWPEEFDRFLARKGVEWGYFTALGAVDSVKFGFYSLFTKKWDEHLIFEELEVCSWSGNVAIRDGKPFAHTHAVLGRKDGSTFGGHIPRGEDRPDPRACSQRLARTDGAGADEGFPCTTLIATVDAPGIDAAVRFVNHLPSWKPQQEFERERQAVQAARRLEELDGQVIVVGDFEVDPEAASVRFWTGRQSLAGVSVC